MNRREKIDATDEYLAWFNGLRDNQMKARISDRINRLSLGNAGDHKNVGGGVWELRLDVAGGIRIYYGRINWEVVLLLAGGDKSTQSKDIKKAKALIAPYRKGKRC